MLTSNKNLQFTDAIILFHVSPLVIEAGLASLRLSLLARSTFETHSLNGSWFELEKFALILHCSAYTCSNLCSTTEGQNAELFC